MLLNSVTAESLYIKNYGLMHGCFVSVFNAAVCLDRSLCLESCRQILQILSIGCESFLRQTEVSRLFLSVFCIDISRRKRVGC